MSEIQSHQETAVAVMEQPEAGINVDFLVTEDLRIGEPTVTSTKVPEAEETPLAEPKLIPVKNRVLIEEQKGRRYACLLLCGLAEAKQYLPRNFPEQKTRERVARIAWSYVRECESLFNHLNTNRAADYLHGFGIPDEMIGLAIDRMHKNFQQRMIDA